MSDNTVSASVLAKRKREERRARILANSKSRMNMIHGQSSPAGDAGSSDAGASASAPTVTPAPASASQEGACAATSAQPSVEPAARPSRRAGGNAAALRRAVNEKTASPVERTQSPSPPTSSDVKTSTSAPAPASASEYTRGPQRLTDKPALVTQLAAVVGLSDVLAAVLGAVVAVVTAARVGRDSVYGEFATGTLSTTWPLVVPFTVQEVAINGAALQAEKNPFTYLFGALRLGRRFCIFMFVFLVTIEAGAHLCAPDDGF